MHGWKIGTHSRNVPYFGAGSFDLQLPGEPSCNLYAGSSLMSHSSAWTGQVDADKDSSPNVSAISILRTLSGDISNFYIGCINSHNYSYDGPIIVCQSYHFLSEALQSHTLPMPALEQNIRNQTHEQEVCSINTRPEADCARRKVVQEASQSLPNSLTNASIFMARLNSLMVSIVPKLACMWWLCRTALHRALDTHTQLACTRSLLE